MHLPVDFHQFFTKGVSRINEQLLKWRDVQRKSPRKKSLKKTLGGLHPPPPPPPPLVRPRINASAQHFLSRKNIEDLTRLEGEHQKICEGLITEEECLSALKQFSRKIRPGSYVASLPGHVEIKFNELNSTEI